MPASSCGRPRAPAPVRNSLRARPCAAANRRRATAPRSRGPPAPKRQPRQRAGKVGRCLQLLAQVLAQARLRRRDRRPRRDAHSPPPDRSAGCRAGWPSSRAPAAVTVRSMAASRLPARAPWFERTSSRLARVAASMMSRLPAVLLARRAEQRRFADLGDLDIGEQPGERGKLRPGELAERIERGDAETLLQGPLAALPNRNGRAGMASGRRQPPRLRRRSSASPARSSPTSTSPGLSRASSPARSLARDRRGDQLAGGDVERGERVTRLAALLSPARGTGR